MPLIPNHTHYIYNQRLIPHTPQLYPDTDNENAIGAFQPRGKKALITDPPPPAPFLQLSHHTKVDRDEILVALLLIEKARRFGKKVTANSFGDALFFGGIGSGFTGTF